MMNRRCDQCRFWTPPDATEYWHPVRSVMGECKKTPQLEDMCSWDIDGEGETVWAITPEHERATATTVDGSGYYSGLLTKPEHFCSMWEYPHQRDNLGGADAD